MLPRDQALALLRAALREFAPEWDVVGECAEVTLRDPDHWLSGIGTFGGTLRHAPTGALKVFGRRAGGEPGAAHHRGLSFLVLEAYGERNTDPIRRYFDELGLLAPAAATARPTPRSTPRVRPA
jgi:hypothetical protein